MKTRTFLKASLLPLLLASVLGPACGSSTATLCMNVCDATNCAGSPMVDCASACAKADAEVSTAGCTSQLDDWLSCEDSAPHTCGVAVMDPCGTQSDALNACIASYCKANPKASICPASVGTGGSTG